MSYVTLFSPGPQSETSGGYIAIDLTSAITIGEFLAFCRFWLPVALIVSFYLWVIQENSLLVYVQLPLTVVFLVITLYLGRYPSEGPLLAWTWFSIGVVLVIGGWSFVKFATSASKAFTAALLIPWSVVILFFWVIWRVSQRPEAMSDRPEESTFLKLGIGASEPRHTSSLVDTWLSGGWRTMLLLGSVWGFAVSEVGATAVTSSLYLALSIGSLMAAGLVVLPVRHCLEDNTALAINQAIADNRLNNVLRPGYQLFLLRQVLKRPKAMIWFAVSILLVAAGAACLLGGAASIEPLAVEGLNVREFLPFAFLLMLALAFFCQRRGAQHAMQNATTRVSQTEDYSLYLRSFIDDQVEVLRDGLIFRVWLVDPFLNVLRFVRFEEILAKSVWSFGKTLALGRPGETLPELGALRVTPSREDWQQLVAALIDKAKHVVMTVGFTSGLKWEFQWFLGSVDLRKLSLVLLPDSPESMRATWQQFSADYPALLSCPEDVVARSLAVRFSPDQSLPIFLTAERPSVSAFRLALNVCWLPADSLLQIEPRTGSPDRSGWISLSWIAVLILSTLLVFAWYRFHPRTDVEQEREQYIEKAEEGDPAAMNNLGYSYNHQEKPNYWRASQWFLRAAANGSEAAMNNLGYLYEHGQGVAQNFKRAQQWYAMAASRGSAAAMEHLRSLARESQRLSWEKAAARGDPVAMYSLGVLYTSGQGGARDYLRGRQWFEKAAASGHAPAMFNLGVLYTTGEGVTQDYQRAFQWYEKAAGAGLGVAMFNLGVLYANGQGVAQDYQQAQRWYERARTLGDAGAMLNLGILYANGQGVPRNYARARLLYEEAARAGNAAFGRNVEIAENNLRAKAYGEEQIVTEDVAQLGRYMQAAAVALNLLGEIYYYGLGVPRSYQEARERFQKSSDQGYAPSMIRMADLYIKGQGVPRDYQQAREWLEKAEAAGSTVATWRLQQWPFDISHPSTDEDQQPDLSH